MHRRRLGALVAAPLTLAVVPTLVRRGPEQDRPVTLGETRVIATSVLPPPR
jgi:hypothetical protein